MEYKEFHLGQAIMALLVNCVLFWLASMLCCIEAGSY